VHKFLLLVAGVVLAGGTLTACLGGPPPDQPDPHDVLVVGDSVSFSLGCVLGDGNGCPPRPGYTTANEYSGACTIAPGTLSLYNGGTAGAPNCDTQPDQFGRTWQQAAAHFVPKVVVINTAGWEIVDRWLTITQPPDYEWGDPGCSPQNVCSANYKNAAEQYSSQLYDAINMFRSFGAKVVVSESPYIQPLQPEPPNDGTVPPDLACAWWEAYPQSPPTAQGDPNNPLTCPGAWRPPPNTSGVTYRSSKTKIDQLNTIVELVKNNYFNNDPNVLLFNFKKHFNPGGAYSDYVCPPPHDSDTVPQNVLDMRPGSPTFGQLVWQCNIDGNPLHNVNAILARAIDHSHLSPAGEFQILQPYLEPCVQSLLGIGGDASKCS
jgi:hypothetical protein